MPSPTRRGRQPATTKSAVAGRRAALLAQLELPEPPADMSPMAWSEDHLLWQIVTYIRGNAGRRTEGLDQRLQRLYPGVPGMRLLCHHETDSRRTRAGWLDLTIAGPGGHDFAELKTEARRATGITPEQQEWLDVFERGGATVFVWSPRDWMSGAIPREINRLARPLAQPRPARQPAPDVHKCGCLAGAPHTCVTWGGLT